MARQHVVRALVPEQRVPEVLRLLRDEFDLEERLIEVSEPDPGLYRDEAPDRELRHLVRVGRTRVAIGALVGALVGLAVGLAVPALTPTVLWAPLLAFFAAGVGGAVAAARGVQRHRDEGPRGEQLHRVDPADRAQVRLVTVHGVRDRVEVADRLADAEVTLLDTEHPRVGRDGPGQRPAGRHEDGAGPPAR